MYLLNPFLLKEFALGLNNLAKLKCVYLEHNVIEKIEGLDTLLDLEVLELTDNRIQAIENLVNQHNLRELYLRRNRIRSIENISHFSKLSVLSISVWFSCSVNSFNRDDSGKPHREAGESRHTCGFGGAARDRSGNRDIRRNSEAGTYSASPVSN